MTGTEFRNEVLDPMVLAPSGEETSDEEMAHTPEVDAAAPPEPQDPQVTHQAEATAVGDGLEPGVSGAGLPGPGNTSTASTPGPTPSPRLVEASGAALSTVRPAGLTRAARAVNAPAREGWRGSLNQLGFSLKPGPLEHAARHDMQTTCANLARSMTLMVANPDGGAGKTPLTITLAGTIGVARGGGVAALDDNELRGDLGDRTDNRGSVATVRDLLADQDLAGGRKEGVDRYLRHQSAGMYKVLASADDGLQMLTAADFDQVHSALSRFYDVLIIDTGNNEQAPNWLAAARVADQLVVPVKWKWTSCNKADKMLRTLQATGFEDLVANAIVVGTNGPGDRSQSKDDVANYREYFTTQVRAVLDLPIDPHIHADNVIVHDALQPATKRAATRISAAIFEHLSTLSSTPHRTE